MAISMREIEERDKFAKYGGLYKSYDEYLELKIKWLLETLPDTIYYERMDGIDVPYKPNRDIKVYDVWMDGYSCGEDSAGVELVGRTEAKSFAEACHKLFCMRFLNDPDCRWDYEPIKLSFWARDLYMCSDHAKKGVGRGKLYE